MAIQTSGLTESGREREMTVYLRGLVDTVLEEGNLDSAIALLDRLRSPVYKPYGPHIRDVLYLALFPPPSTDAPTVSAPILDSIPLSPSKFAAKNRQPFSLSPVLIEAAQSLLRILIQTNSPESIARALPNYGLTALHDLPEIKTIAENDEDDGESELARLSKRIKDAKSCWDIIKENFIRHDTADDAPRTSGRKGGRRSVVEPTFVSDESDELPKPVAEHAFPVLESLIALFEKEELLMSAQHDLRFSPHFLAQLPASRTASGSRWDVAAPLDAAFYCLQQQGHTSLGVRLLTLLINLTNTVYLDLAMFLNATSNRLLSTSIEALQSIFTLLPQSTTSLRFQISLCQSCLSHSSPSGQRVRPRPQARNAPRPVASRSTEDSLSKEATSSLSVSASSTLTRKFPSLLFGDILQTFSAALPPPDSDPLALQRRLYLKFFLINAVGEIQERTMPEERDPEWTRIVQSGEIAQAIDAAFTLPENFTQAADREVAEDLKTMLSLASAGWCR